MLRLRTRGINAAGWLTILALIAMTSIIGCGGKEEAPTAAGNAGTRSGAGGEEDAELAAALASTGGAAPAAAATGGRRGGGRAGGAAAGDTGGPAPAAAAQAATPAVEGEAVAEDSGIPEVDAAQKIQNFANLYGPITRVQERNWDDRVIEWVVFTPPNATWVTPAHRGRRARLPLSMIMDADTPEALEGYFQIYPTGSSAGETVSSQTITASAEPQAAGATQTTATETQPAKPQATAAAAPKPAESQAPAEAAPARAGRRGGGRGGRAQ